MKIGILIDDSLDFPDGVQQYVLTIGSWLARQGHEVHYIASTTNRSDLSNVHSLAKNMRVAFNRNILRIPLPAKKSDIKKLIKKESFDVIHVQMPYSPFFAGRVITRIPASTAVVGTFHVAPYSRREIFGAMLLRPLYSPSLKRFDRIASVSESAQVFAKQAFGITSEIIPNAVPIKQFRRSSPPRNRDAVIELRFLGRLVKRKGCHLLLLAMRELRRRYPDTAIHLTIAGGGPEKATLTRLAKSYELGDCVTFYGDIDRKDIPKFFAEADILVFPSTGGESFGIILVEAMAAGSSVVLAGDNPGYRKVIADDQVLFNPHKTKEFADIIHRFAIDRKLRQTVAKRQQKRADCFDEGVVGKKVEDWYKKALANKDVTSVM